MSVCLCVRTDICTENKAVQAEIVDLHNAFRRAVQPTASDMLKMVSPAFCTIKVANDEVITFSNGSRPLFSLTYGKEKRQKKGEVLCMVPEKS